MTVTEIIIALVLVVTLAGSVASYSLVRNKKHRGAKAPQNLTSAPMQSEVQTSRTKVAISDDQLPSSSPRDVDGTEIPKGTNLTMASGLARSRPRLSATIGSLFRKNAIDDSFWEELTDSLILADVGLEISEAIVQSARAEVKRDKITEPKGALEVLRCAMRQELLGADRSLVTQGDKPLVWLFVGVNGVGKTTTIGKVANTAVLQGDKVMLAAADTFRAAASDQLSLWAQRAGAEIVSGAPGSDPASVLYDAISSARARGFDVVLGDTAGRLHNKFNLIEELKKIYRIVSKAQGNLVEVLLVLDATIGQNGLAQAKVFSEAVGVTGVVLTKLDGSAKGGIAFSIERTFGIPVKLVGVGEGIDDLIPFDPQEYVESLTTVD